MIVGAWQKSVLISEDAQTLVALGTHSCGPGQLSRLISISLIAMYHHLHILSYGHGTR